MFLPYLTGYVAFYTGDYKTAVEDLQKANQDAFNMALIGQAYEKLGDKDKAMEYFRKFWRRVDDKIKLRRRRELLRIERRQKKLARAQAQPEAEKMRG